MIVQPITLAAALHVVERVRADDAAEIFATHWTDDRLALARGAATRGPLAWAAGLDGEPIACIGAEQCWPGVWQAWMFATDRFDEIGFSLTKFARRVIIPAAAAAGAHRLQAYSSETHAVAHRWLEFLGAMHEATHPGFGKGGETFRCYAMRLG